MSFGELVKDGHFLAAAPIAAGHLGAKGHPGRSRSASPAYPRGLAAGVPFLNGGQGCQQSRVRMTGGVSERLRG